MSGNERAALLAEALTAHAAGLCVVPPRQNGSKRPAPDTSEDFQRQRPSEAQILDWYNDPIFAVYTGLGLVCGAISGNLGFSSSTTPTPTPS